MSSRELSNNRPRDYFSIYTYFIYILLLNVYTTGTLIFHFLFFCYEIELSNIMMKKSGLSKSRSASNYFALLRIEIHIYSFYPLFFITKNN